MNHLSDIEIESIVQGQTPLPVHVQECESCSARLAEKQALAKRLRTAFSTLRAGDELAERIVFSISGNTGHSRSFMAIKRLFVSSNWRYWAATAAAIVVVPLMMMVFMPSTALAAKEELVKIHHHNLDPDHTFFSESDPEKLANYFKRNLGFNPLIPKTGQGLALRGCCVKHFRGRESGSYVVDTPNGIMSIIVVQDTLKELGMGDHFVQKGYAFGKTSFEKNNMVSVRIGYFTYCAVGEISFQYLTDLLVQLLTDIHD